MRKTIPLLLLLGILIVGNALGQIPKFINYQAIARNNKGEPLKNQLVALRASVLTGSTESPSEFAEVHSISTNQFGLFTIAIGNGVTAQGVFKNINWVEGPKFLKIEIDFEGKSNFQLLGVTQFLSVPYALYAETSGTPLKPGDGISISNNTVANTAPDVPVTITGSGSSNVTGTYPNYNIHTPVAGNYTAGSGIAITGTVITNSKPDQAVVLNGTGGTNVTGSYPNFTISSPQLTAGTGVSINGSNQIVNTSPDQAVVLNGTGATNVTGTYPNFTISSPQLTAGTGISINGSNQIINSAPDKTVTISASGTTSVTGTYPDFIINTSGFNFQYPDGFNNIQSFVHSFSSSAEYIVPPGKNLYITFVSQKLFNLIVIDGINIGNNNDSKGFVVAGGSKVTSLLSTLSFCGYLVDQIVTPLIQDLALGPYQIPAGKTLYILKGSTDTFSINNQFMGDSSFLQPIILGGGQTISSSAGFKFNGFLK